MSCNRIVCLLRRRRRRWISWWRGERRKRADYDYDEPCSSSVSTRILYAYIRAPEYVTNLYARTYVSRRARSRSLFVAIFFFFFFFFSVHRKRQTLVVRARVYPVVLFSVLFFFSSVLALYTSHAGITYARVHGKPSDEIV